MTEFEKLLKEWDTIKSAPRTFAGVVVLTVCGLFFGFHSYYSERLSGLKDSANYWKERAERPPAPVETTKPVETPPAQPAQRPPVEPPGHKASKPTTQKPVPPSDSVPAANPPPTQSAPGGINIGRDNNGTVTENNFAPPARHLNQQQITSIQELVVSDIGKMTWSVTTTNDVGSQNYASEIYEAIAAANKPGLKQGPIVGLGSWHPRAPENVIVCGGPDRSIMAAAALRIANILGADGTTKIVVVASCVNVPASELGLIIGPQT